jgi:small subunit ribosomal protein S17
MAEEDKDKTQEPEESQGDDRAPEVPETAAEETAAGDENAAPEEPAAAEPEVSEPAPQEAAAEEPAAPAAEAPAADAGSAPAPAPPAREEVLSPRERRRRTRSRARAPANPPRSPEERSRERAEARHAKATVRRRWRAKQRERRRATGAEAPPAQPAPERAQGTRKVRQGVVVSNKGDKTITVRIDSIRRHRVYGKVVRASSTFRAHDERNEASEGDVVRVAESRPLSRTKRWRLVQVIQKAR